MEHSQPSASVLRRGVTQPDLAGLAVLQSNMMRHYFRLAQVQERLVRRAPGPVPGALEAERTRMARELHAGAGQALAGIKIHLEVIDSLLQNPPAQVRASLQRIGLLVQQALDDIRSIARRDYPQAWERMELGEAIAQLWSLSGIPLKYQATLEIGAFPEEPAHRLKVLLYRTVQEILANVIRHAQATQVWLRLWCAGGRILLRVEDNGRGFDPSAAQAGIGLRSLRDQLEAAGGDLTVESGETGTAIAVSLPGAG